MVQTKQVCATVFLCYNLILLSIHAIYFVFPYQINFIRLSMAPASVQYAYRMNGGEGRWTDIGERNTVYFTNLLPGHYLLEVRATNLSNRWSPNVTRLEIEVLPAWWARPIVEEAIARTREARVYIMDEEFDLGLIEFFLFLIFKQAHVVGHFLSGLVAPPVEN